LRGLATARCARGLASGNEKHYRWRKKTNGGYPRGDKKKRELTGKAPVEGKIKSVKKVGRWQKKRKGRPGDHQNKKCRGLKKEHPQQNRAKVFGGGGVQNRQHRSGRSDYKKGGRVCQYDWGRPRSKQNEQKKKTWGGRWELHKIDPKWEMGAERKCPKKSPTPEGK